MNNNGLIDMSELVRYYLEPESRIELPTSALPRLHSTN